MGFSPQFGSDVPISLERAPASAFHRQSLSTEYIRVGAGPPSAREGAGHVWALCIRPVPGASPSALRIPRRGGMAGVGEGEQELSEPL